MIHQLLKRYSVDSDQNVIRVCQFILEKFDIKYTTWKLKQVVGNSIEARSLLAVKDVLFGYGVESAAIRKNTYRYGDFEMPIVCAIQQEDWAYAAFTVVTACENDEVTYLDPVSDRLQSCSISHFESIDKDIVLLLDDSERKDEVGYIENRRKEKTERVLSSLPLYAFLSVLMLSIYIQFESFSRELWISPLFFFTSIIGLLISALLMWHEVDSHNPLIKEVCGGAGNKKLNCTAVLTSSGSKFLGISWSVWGFAYFAAFFGCQLVFAAQLSYVVLWVFLSLITLLYVPYSIYYQGKVVKTWCPLCIAMQVVILVNGLFATIFFYNHSIVLNFSIQSLFNVVLFGVGALLSGYYTIPLLKKAREAKGYEKRWKKLRFHPDIFQSLLKKNTPISVSPEGLGIVLGNPHASREIIKVCNPYCGPCSKAHPELEYIIENNSDVRLRIIFTGNGENDDIRTAPVSHLLAIQEKYDGQKLKHALDDWYSAKTKDYDVFSKKYPMNGGLEQQNEKIYAMRDWCDAMKIRATPTIYVDGYELPESYVIAELKNFF